jgi:hypothetical protein
MTKQLKRFLSINKFKQQKKMQQTYLSQGVLTTMKTINF